MALAIVAGALANKPLNGGDAWVRLSWALGLRRLGFRVHLVEQIERETCVDADGRRAPFAESLNLAYFRSVTDRFGLAGDATLVCDGGRDTAGLAFDELRDVAAAADVLVNVSGHLSLDALLRPIGRKAYVDVDPGYTQFWHVAGQTGARIAGHDHYFTVGANVGSRECSIPTGGIRWHPIRPPVVLEEWPPSQVGDGSRFTTVASWRGAYGPAAHGGRRFGVKAHEFRKVIDLPRRVPQTLELAVDIDPADSADLAALNEHGWRLIDPKSVAAEPEAYRRYIQTSGGEFSVAQGIYVETRSGWFSDRTAHYLASGKPAVVHDTGLVGNMPLGEGLIAFSTLDDAVQAIERVAGDYEAHSRAARALAEQYLDSDVVLERVLGAVGIQ